MRFDLLNVFSSPIFHSLPGFSVTDQSWNNIINCYALRNLLNFRFKSISTPNPFAVGSSIAALTEPNSIASISKLIIVITIIQKKTSFSRYWKMAKIYEKRESNSIMCYYLILFFLFSFSQSRIHHRNFISIKLNKPRIENWFLWNQCCCASIFAFTILCSVFIFPVKRLVWQNTLRSSQSELLTLEGLKLCDPLIKREKCFSIVNSLAQKGVYQMISVYISLLVNA